MKHLTYFTWPELKVGDRFRFAWYDDLYIKVSDYKALCLGGSNGHRLSKRGDKVEVGDNVGGILLSL